MSQTGNTEKSTSAVLRSLTEAVTLFETYERPIGWRRYRQIIQAIRLLRQAAEQEMQKNREAVLPSMLAGQIGSQTDDVYVRLVAYYPYKRSCYLLHLQERQALVTHFKTLIAKIKEWEQAVSP